MVVESAVQTAIEQKKIAFKRWQRSRSEADRLEYCSKNRMAKRRAAISKREAWQEWSQNLSTPEGQNKMFRVAAQMRKDRKDVHGTKYIKDENGNIVVKEKEVRDRWRRYFSTLLNEENPNHIEDVEVIEGPIQEISLDEVNGALKTMKNNKAPGPSGITSDIIKLAGETGIIELHRTLQKIASNKICPEEWQQLLFSRARETRWNVESTEDLGCWNTPRKFLRK